MVHHCYRKRCTIVTENAALNITENAALVVTVYTPDDLYVTTAREFGFKRTGENIVSSLRQVYDKILNIGRLKEVDGKVNII